jgi:SAM-dependent methyltransferase
MNLSFYLRHTGTLRLAFDIVAKKARAPKCWPHLEAALRDRDGIEVGGPSPIFESDGRLPVYPIIKSLKNFGFQANEGTFVYAGRSGPSQRCEASALPVDNASCDFLLSSHVLEHMANTLQALREWHRALKPNGNLLLILPDGARTFDHKRNTTEWEHLLADFHAATPESDRTHIAHALELTDTKHWSFNEWPGWQNCYENNVEHRAIHHHVFNVSLARKALVFSGFRVLISELVFPFNIVLLAAKQP